MNLSAHTQAVVDTIADAGIPTDRGVKPDGAGWTGAPGQSAFTGYAIVWRLGSRDVRHRDLDGRWDERRPMFHVRVVGADAAQTDDLLDDVIETVTTTPIVVADMAPVHLVYDSSITTSRDDDVPHPVYYSGVYFRLWTQETS